MQKKGRCIIVGAGDFDESVFLPKERDDLLIAADGGLNWLKKAGAEPDFFIGDTDSLGAEPQGIPSRILPTVKDDTDLFSAVKFGLEQGYTDFVLYGVLGGERFSHSIAAVQTLLYLQKVGARAKISDARCTAFIMQRECYLFPPSQKGYFSLFCLSPSARVSLSGVKYELHRKKLLPSFPLGVSNEFCGKDASLVVHSGICLLVLEKKKQR